MTAAEYARPTSSNPLGPEASFAHRLLSYRRLILILATLSAVLWTTLYLQFTVDDAYISFRYGHNFIAHHVWNWNPTGPHEEAYTSAIYTALGVLPALLHLSPALFFKLFGLACVAAMLFRLRASASPFAVLLGTLLIAADPHVWIHTFAGLETPLYMLLILELALCTGHARTVSPTYVYALCLLLPLTRPEGIVFGVAGLILFWRGRGMASKHLAQFTAATLLGLTYFVTRWHYFHHLLPNPFYDKISHYSWPNLLSAFADNLPGLAVYVLILLLILFAARRLATRVFAISALALMLFFFAPHVMPMNYAGRFYFQLAFPVALIFLIAEDLTPISRLATAITALLIICASPTELRRSLAYFPTLQQTDIDLGRRLAPFASGHTLLTGEAGAIPYYSGWVTYDFLGLGTYDFTDSQITLAKLQRIHPDLILLYTAAPTPASIDDLANPGPLRSNTSISKFIRQSADYDFAGASRSNGYYLVAFLRRGTSGHDAILAALARNTQTSAAFHPSLKPLLLQRYVPWSQ